MHLLARTAVVALALPAALAGTASPALALDPSITRTYSSVQTNWLSSDDTAADSGPGNVHLGFLDVRRSGAELEVFGVISDLQCPAGVTPFEEAGEACVPVGDRLLTAAPGLRLVADVRGGFGRLSGRLLELAVGEDGQVLEDRPTARPLVDLRFTRAGSTYRYARSEEFDDGEFRFESRTRGTGFPAEVSGRLGALGFQDVLEGAFGSVEQFTTRETAPPSFEDLLGAARRA